MKNFSELEQAVLVTVAYCDQFSYPLTTQEIVSRLAFPPSQDSDILSSSKIKEALKTLLRKKVLEQSSGYYFLSKRSELLSWRKRRLQYSKEKKLEATSLIQFARRIPWVSAIFITGSLAMNNADQESDIDFMIITDPKRLWLCRILFSIFAQVHGKRRSWKGEEENSWCFNLWLDHDHLQVPLPKRSMYQAYEVTQAVPVFLRTDTSFYQQNSWVIEYLPFFRSSFHQRYMHQQNSRFSFFLDGVDWLSWKLQEWYMSSHRTREKVGRGFAFFHPRDTQKLVSQGLKTSLNRVLTSQEINILLKRYDLS